MEVTYYRGSKEMKATIDLTIDKSALTQQNNRSNQRKKRPVVQTTGRFFFILYKCRTNFCIKRQF